MKKEMTNAACLRKDLKSIGYTTTILPYGNVSPSIIVLVKNVNADYIKIENIAVNYVNVSYCDVTGETLSGGNTFVDVNYSDKAKSQIAEMRIAQITDCNNVEGIKIYVHGQNDIRVKDQSCYTKEDAAVELHKLLMAK